MRFPPCPAPLPLDARAHIELNDRRRGDAAEVHRKLRGARLVAEALHPLELGFGGGLRFGGGVIRRPVS